MRAHHPLFPPPPAAHPRPPPALGGSYLDVSRCGPATAAPVEPPAADVPRRFYLRMYNPTAAVEPTVLAALGEGGADVPAIDVPRSRAATDDMVWAAQGRGRAARGTLVTPWRPGAG